VIRRPLFKSLIALFLFQAQPVLGGEDDQPIVCGQLGGQLGNQLFIAATTLAYAWDYNAYPMFPALNVEMSNLPYNRDHIFFRLDANTPSRPITTVFTETKWNSDARVPFVPDQLLWGCFQSWAHFHHHRAKILEIFSPRQEDIDYLNAVLESMIWNPS